MGVIGLLDCMSLLGRHKQSTTKNSVKQVQNRRRYFYITQAAQFSARLNYNYTFLDPSLYHVDQKL